MAKTTPPKWPVNLLRKFCHPDYVEDIEGDLLERFHKWSMDLGPQRARRKFIKEIMMLFRPSLLRKVNTKLNHISMLKSHTKISFRYLRRNLVYSSINSITLTIGILTFLLIYSVIRFETSYDMFHSDHENIYRIVRVSQVEGETEYRRGVVYPLPPAIENQIPEVESITSVLYWSWGGVDIDILNEEGNSMKNYKEDKGFVMLTPSFFKVFDFKHSNFKWISGSPETALSKTYSLVLTKSMAQKYFPDENAMGKIIELDKYQKYTVRGIIEDLPKNSDFPFKIIASYSTLQEMIGDRKNKWGPVGSNECYLKLLPNTSIRDIEEKMDQIHQTNAGNELAEMRKYKLQPLAELHSDCRFGNFNNRVFPSSRVWTLTIVGAFILIVACINYINLSTANSMGRWKEVGIRKVLGGHRAQLITQFLTEAFIISGLSGLLAYLMAVIFTGDFNQLLGTPNSILLLDDLPTLLLLLGLIVFINISAGLIPASMISSLKPIKALKTKLTTGQSSMGLRQGLVSAQFAITQICLIGTFVVFTQINYFQSIDLGFNKESILTAAIPYNKEKADLFRNKLSEIPGVEKVSLSVSVPAGDTRNRSFIDISKPEWPSNESLIFEYQTIDTEFLALYDIEIVAGRSFMSFDTTGQIILNETLTRKLGYTDPAEVINQKLSIGVRDVVVVGVCEDYHSKSLREELDKIGFMQANKIPEIASIKLAREESLSQIIPDIEAVWSSVYPEFVFDIEFFDDQVEAYYQEDRRFSKLIQLASVVFILISILGMYGLVSFLLQKKLKEIAIRKVLGARIFHIYKILLKSYIPSIIFSVVFALPLGYYLMEKWLNQFKFHIEINWMIMTLPPILVLLLTLISVSGKSLKAAKTNPSTIIRNE